MTKEKRIRTYEFACVACQRKRDITVKAEDIVGGIRYVCDECFGTYSNGKKRLRPHVKTGEVLGPKLIVCKRCEKWVGGEKKRCEDCGSFVSKIDHIKEVPRSIL